LRRIRSYHEKARNILNDWTKKISLEIIRLAKDLRYAVSREDLTNLIRSLRDLPKDHKRKLIIMGYSRFEKWIDWQAEKKWRAICEGRSKRDITRMSKMRL